MDIRDWDRLPDMLMGWRQITKHDAGIRHTGRPTHRPAVIVGLWVNHIQTANPPAPSGHRVQQQASEDSTAASKKLPKKPPRNRLETDAHRSA